MVSPFSSNRNDSTRGRDLSRLPPHVSLVEQDDLQEQVSERRLSDGGWSAEQRDIARNRTSVRVHLDPAVAMEGYAAAAREKAAKRQEAERQKQLRLAHRRAADSAGQLIWLAGGATFVMQGLAMAVCILSAIAPPLMIVGASLSLVGLMLLRVTLWLYAEQRLRQPAPAYLSAGTAAGLMWFAGADLIVLGAKLNGLLPFAAGAMCLVIGYGFIWQTALCYRRLVDRPS